MTVKMEASSGALSENTLMAYGIIVALVGTYLTYLNVVTGIAVFSFFGGIGAIAALWWGSDAIKHLCSYGLGTGVPSAGMVAFGAGAIAMIAGTKFGMASPIVTLILAAIIGAVIGYIANNIKDNVRLLEGSLISIFARASLTKSQINIQFVRDVITHLISDINDRNVSIHSISAEDIIKVVCDYFKVNETQIKGRKRDASIVLPRHIAIYLIKKYTNLSLKDIARQIGKKDHSTIIHSINKIERLIKIDQNLSTDVMNIISLLNVD